MARPPTAEQIRYQAALAQSQPLIQKEHPAAAHAAEASRATQARTAQKRAAMHYRATVVAGGASPATVQLAGSDAAVVVPLAQHVDPTTIVAGGTVIVTVFDPQNPNDALIVAAY